MNCAYQKRLFVFYFEEKIKIIKLNIIKLSNIKALVWDVVYLKMCEVFVDAIFKCVIAKPCDSTDPYVKIIYVCVYIYIYVCTNCETASLLPCAE